MTRKRRSGIPEAEAVLQRVIRVIETTKCDGILGTDPGPEAVDALHRRFHAAFVDLLTHGPLDCAEAVARESEAEHPALPLHEVSLLRAELLQLVRSAVRQGQIGASSTPISTNGHITFAVRLVEGGRAVIAATGATRGLIILQIVLLLQEVGLANVRECLAPDCRRLFVKVYRREFCSVQCQKRVNTRKQRRNAQEQKERLARRRRQRRKTGA